MIRHRTFDLNQQFLPDGLSRVGELRFLTPAERRLISQIQGRTYANLLGLVERFIGAKVLEVSRDHWLGDQTAREALVRFSDEELKHQELFRRLERMTAAGMPDGYCFLPQPNEVAAVVLGKATWAVLALTCHIELFTQAHYRSSIAAEVQIDPLWKDVFLYHWREESQHAILDKLEWQRENARLTATERDRAVDDLITLVAAVGAVLGEGRCPFAVERFRRPGEPQRMGQRPAQPLTLVGQAGRGGLDHRLHPHGQPVALATEVKA